MVLAALERLIRGQYSSGTAPAEQQQQQQGEAAGATAAVAQRRSLQMEGGADAATSLQAAQDDSSKGGEADSANPIDAPIPLEACDWLNATACNATGASLKPAAFM